MNPCLTDTEIQLVNILKEETKLDSDVSRHILTYVL